jgi:hypothetical protein
LVGFFGKHKRTNVRRNHVFWKLSAFFHAVVISENGCTSLAYLQSKKEQQKLVKKICMENFLAVKKMAPNPGWIRNVALKNKGAVAAAKLQSRLSARSEPLVKLLASTNRERSKDR